MSKELKSYLSDLGIATSRTSYNPQGNGQCERYNGIIWKTIELALRSQNLPIPHWEVVMLYIQYALSSAPPMKLHTTECSLIKDILVLVLLFLLG